MSNLHKDIQLTRQDLNEALGDDLVEQIGDALVEHLTDKYGYCINSLSWGIKTHVEWDLDD